MNILLLLLPPDLLMRNALVAKTGEFSYQVSLQRYSDSKHFCGGAILNPDWILTAGGCVDDTEPPAIYAVAGSIYAYVGHNYDIELAVLHPNYKPNNDSFNLALLRPTNAIKLDHFVKEIGINLAFVEPRERVTLAGWGSTTHAGGPMSDVLRWVYYITLSNKECRRRMSDEIQDRPLYNSSLCAITAVGSGACAGDMGSPVVFKELLIGVHLWSYGCGSEYPDVFIRVFRFRRWIRNMMSQLHRGDLVNQKCMCRRPNYCKCKRIVETESG